MGIQEGEQVFARGIAASQKKELSPQVIHDASIWTIASEIYRDHSGGLGFCDPQRTPSVEMNLNGQLYYASMFKAEGEDGKKDAFKIYLQPLESATWKGWRELYDIRQEEPDHPDAPGIGASALNDALEYLKQKLSKWREEKLPLAVQNLYKDCLAAVRSAPLDEIPENAKARILGDQFTEDPITVTFGRNGFNYRIDYVKTPTDPPSPQGNIRRMLHFSVGTTDNRLRDTFTVVTFESPDNNRESSFMELIISTHSEPVEKAAAEPDGQPGIGTKTFIETDKGEALKKAQALLKEHFPPVAAKNTGTVSSFGN